MCIRDSIEDDIKSAAEQDGKDHNDKALFVGKIEFLRGLRDGINPHKLSLIHI